MSSTQKLLVFTILLCSIYAWDDSYNYLCPSTDNDPVSTFNYASGSLNIFGSERVLKESKSTVRFYFDDTQHWATYSYYYYINSDT
jgi:hypothetical protein